MTSRPRIPMRPQDRPPQPGQHPLPLPPRPPDFEGHCDFEERMPDSLRPKGSPRKVRYLGSVEWAWGPCNDRLDSYYLHPTRSHWLLWLRGQEEYGGRWVWVLYAYAPRGEADDWQAACYLLMDAWKAEADGRSRLDRYHWIDGVGALSVEEFEAIAAVVWPGAEQE